MICFLFKSNKENLNVLKNHFTIKNRMITSLLKRYDGSATVVVKFVAAIVFVVVVDPIG